MRLIKQGAEAKIYIAEFSELYFDYPIKVIVKERIQKRYRIPEIDLKLRKERTIREARILHRAKQFGVHVPYVFEVDTKRMIIVMEYIEGERLKELLERLPMEERLRICREVGREVGKLHEAGIVHGDLTTSNMIMRGGNVYFIDFGLAEFDDSLEAQGVDLHLLKRAMESTHYRWFERGFMEVLRGYEEIRGSEVRKDIEDKIREIELRGRYRERRWIS
ncbi:Kae1-associated kinase Bud32 [Pyrococcus sp. NA2]|uniref:Kae1-associated kinase Bud32 n=1 Tax=Pyrococcus sp. (strain NA2) TaxID=342949 RepID=UPI00064F7212|nr:Kae1-associated kinase Bud32 [Pyrococcus sp. NA2]